MKKGLNLKLFLLCSCFAIVVGYSQTSAVDLLEQINNKNQLINDSGLLVDVNYSNSDKRIEITQVESNSTTKYKWIGIKAPKEGWNLKTKKYIEAIIQNTGEQPVEIMFWVVANGGFNAVADVQTLEPNETRNFKCNLREIFPDGTPKLSSPHIQQIQIMLVNASKNTTVEIQNIKATGEVSESKINPDRLIVPDMEIGIPEAGKRVKIQLKTDENTNRYAVLYLPKNWKPNEKYPVIAEFSGNIYFTKSCYSTGLPEHAVIGYGMSKGENAIWVNLPFVDYNLNDVVENGWGNPDDTADYTIKIIEHVIANYGGDTNNMVLTGFSRGAIACGYIGLRNDSIAALWKGFHICQHFDGDGWNGASMDGALTRLKRLKGRSVFHTDNDKVELREMYKNENSEVIFENSGLNYHACDMFLDNRPSTIKLRNWFNLLVEN